MMKPKIEDVIDYVKAGEDDPAMKKLLDLHPDGQEFLKQARFICKMLQDQSATADVGDVAASFDMVGSFEAQVAESRELEVSALYESAAPPRRSMQMDSMSHLIGGAGTDLEDLGTLEVGIEGEHTKLSYHPGKSVMERSGRPYLLKYLAGQQDIEGIQIRGRSINLILPESVPLGETVTVRVIAGRRDFPLRGLDVIFMPESGPFVRMKTDEMGILDFPVPNQSGTLRIDSGIPYLLHVKVKK